MTNKEFLYIIFIGVVAVYAIVLTVILAVMNSKIKTSQQLLEAKIRQNQLDIQQSDRKIKQSVEEIDKKIEQQQQNTEKRMDDLFDNALTATTMLVDEKTRNLSDKMNDISLRIGIMDSAIKNIENEKNFVKRLLKPSEEQPIEADYQNVPKDSFLNNARKTVRNVAKAGGDIVKSFFKSKTDEEE